jgi:hypothetical protein
MQAEKNQASPFHVMPECFQNAIDLWKIRLTKLAKRGTLLG